MLARRLRAWTLHGALLCSLPLLEHIHVHDAELPNTFAQGDISVSNGNYSEFQSEGGERDWRLQLGPGWTSTWHSWCERWFKPPLQLQSQSITPKSIPCTAPALDKPWGRWIPLEGDRVRLGLTKTKSSLPFLGLTPEFRYSQSSRLIVTCSWIMNILVSIHLDRRLSNIGMEWSLLSLSPTLTPTIEIRLSIQEILDSIQRHQSYHFITKILEVSYHFLYLSLHQGAQK